MFCVGLRAESPGHQWLDDPAAAFVSNADGVPELVRNLQGMRWGMEEYRTSIRERRGDPGERLYALQDRSDLDALTDRYDRALVRLAVLVGVEVSIVPGTPEGNPRLSDELRSLLEHAVEALGIDLDPPRR
jgi:hypothetical protein